MDTSIKKIHLLNSSQKGNAKKIEFAERES